mmetsp:Transcript_19328/g.50697  ORF Transcript_19328/g.50697 Transcript_19328/m.50697 type:complete len:132 (-) Transcript_19328:91-486(-)
MFESSGEGRTIVVPPALESGSRLSANASASEPSMNDQLKHETSSAGRFRSAIVRGASCAALQAAALPARHRVRGTSCVAGQVDVVGSVRFNFQGHDRGTGRTGNLVTRGTFGATEGGNRWRVAELENSGCR